MLLDLREQGLQVLMSMSDWLWLMAFLIVVLLWKQSPDA